MYDLDVELGFMIQSLYKTGSHGVYPVQKYESKCMDSDISQFAGELFAVEKVKT